VIHHKDRDRDNNAMENLAVLCPNCHAIEHMKENKEGWKHASTDPRKIALRLKTIERKKNEAQQ
jgi:predicted HNH restriction endonuclease